MFRSQFAQQERGFGGMGGGGGQDNNVHVTAFGDHAQNTGIYSIFCSLYNILRTEVEQDTLSQAFMYNILRKDVEQNKLSQASMLLASMPKTLAFTACLPLCTAYCARSAMLLRKMSAANETYQTFKNYFVISDTRSCRPCQCFRHFMSLNAPFFAHSTLRGSRKRRKGAQT